MRDRYVIEDELGEGGMGRVVAAFDRTLERRVALKMLRTDGDVVRLVREARAIAAFAHPGIVTIHDVLDAADPPCLVMELVEGRTLREVIDGGDGTVAQRLGYLRAIASALAAAHRAGFVHRDLKPENVMIQRDDTIKLLDFGLAQRGASRGDDRVAGTPGYMAPEQLAGWTIDSAVDQYAWGVIAVELLSGVRMDGATPSRARELLTGRVLPPIADAIARTVALDPADRFLTMAEVANAIVADRAVVLARDATTVDALPRRRHPWWWLAVPLIPVLAAAGWPIRDAARTASAHELAPQVLDLEPAFAAPAALRTAGGIVLGVLGAHRHVALATIDVDRVTTRMSELPPLGEPVAILLTPARYFVASARGDGVMVLIGRNLADDAPSAAVALAAVTQRFKVVDMATIANELSHTVFALTDDDVVYTLRVFGGGHAGTAMATLSKHSHPRVVAVAGAHLVDVATVDDGVLVVRRFASDAPPHVLDLGTDAGVPALERDGDRLTVVWADRIGASLHRVTIDGDGRIERTEVEAIAADGPPPQQAGHVLAWSNLDQVYAGCGDSLAAINATRVRVATGPRAAGPWVAPLPGGDNLVAWLGRSAGTLVVHRAIVRCP